MNINAANTIKEQLIPILNMIEETYLWFFYGEF